MRDYKQFFAICKKHGFDYKDKVAEFTNGRTDSLKALTDGEFKELSIRMAHLNAPARQVFKVKPGDKQRKKMISLASQMRWGPEIAQIIGRLDAWCLKQKFKKPLMKHSENELNLLLAIFEQRVYSDYLTDLNK